MTPAITYLKRKRIRHTIYRYDHDPSSASYGLEAAECLQQDPERVFKTLVLESESGELLMAMLPVSRQLALKKLAQAAGVKKVKMADPENVTASTGYIMGGVSPFGQKRLLRAFIDDTSITKQSIFVSAGRRGLEIELAPDVFLSELRAKTASLVS